MTDDDVRTVLLAHYREILDSLEATFGLVIDAAQDGTFNWHMHHAGQCLRSTTERTGFASPAEALVHAMIAFGMPVQDGGVAALTA